MPTWNEIRDHVAKITKTINRKAEELTDTAALHIKLSAKKSELEDEYHTMGRLAYESLQHPSTVPEVENDAGQIQECAERISLLLHDIAVFQEKIDSRKKASHEADTSSQKEDAAPSTDNETTDAVGNDESDKPKTCCSCSCVCASNADSKNTAAEEKPGSEDNSANEQAKSSDK